MKFKLFLMIFILLVLFFIKGLFITDINNKEVSSKVGTMVRGYESIYAFRIRQVGSKLTIDYYYNDMYKRLSTSLRKEVLNKTIDFFMDKDNQKMIKDQLDYTFYYILNNDFNKHIRIRFIDQRTEEEYIYTTSDYESIKWSFIHKKKEEHHE